jgi:hypothetical protein
MRGWLAALLSLGLFFTLSGASADPDSSERPLTDAEAYLLLAELLWLPTPLTGLEHYREVAALRARFAAPANVEQMSLYLFMGFAADVVPNVHASEEYARSIVGVFRADPKLFLAALEKNSFLIKYACGELGEHFSFVGNDAGLPGFIEANEQRIRSQLNSRYADRCLAALRQHAA